MIYARRSPSGHRWRSATSPVRGGFRYAGKARKRRPTQWGAGRKARLRGSARLRLPGTWPSLSFLYKERTKEILMSDPEK